MAAVLADLFFANVLRVQVAVALAHGGHFIVLGLEPDLFAHLAKQRLLQALAGVDPALRKLPRARHIHALADQQAARWIHHQRSHIGPILNHGQNLSPTARADNL